ncbi:MAG: hypothetical protein ACLVB5_11940 [Christensenellales bacterium]
MQRQPDDNASYRLDPALTTRSPSSGSGETIDRDGASVWACPSATT